MPAAQPPRPGAASPDARRPAANPWSVDLRELGRRVLDKKRSEVSLEELTTEMAGGQELAELSHELKR